MLGSEFLVAIVSAKRPKISWHFSRALSESKWSKIAVLVSELNEAGDDADEDAGGGGKPKEDMDGGGGGSVEGGDELAGGVKSTGG